MWTIINGIDRTDKIGPKTIQIAQALNDPMPIAKFRVSDQLSQFLLGGLQEVVIIDETGVANPTINQILNPNFDIYAGVNVVGYWPVQETLTPLPTITYTASSISPSTILIDVSPCTTTGTYYYTQQSLLGTAVPGQTYTFSMTVARASINNSKAQMLIQFSDANGNILQTATKNITANGAATQFVLTSTAPAGTVFATLMFGANVTSVSTAPTGQFTFSNPQFEPQLFTARGIAYPTPLCNHLQANCYVLPNGYTIRQTRLFAGFISRVNRSYNGKSRRWNCEAFSLMKLLDSTYFAGTFSGMTDQTMIHNILQNANYAVHPFGSAVRLITDNNVVSTVQMPTMTFDNISILDALKQIADISGCSFYVDHYGDLHYFPWNYISAPFSLSDNPDNVSSFAYSELQIDEDASQPKSRIIVAGGQYTPTWTDAFTGDGVTRQFTLTQLTPQTPITITTAGATNRVGINGTHTFAQGYNVLLDLNGHFLLFNVAPGNSVAVFANYAFISQIRTRTWSLQSIAATYGIAFDAKVSDNSITTSQAALSRAIGELEEYANSRVVLHFKTQKALVPGQVVPITSALDGLSSVNYLVQKVTTSPGGGDYIEYQVDAGAYVPDIIAIIKHLHKQNALDQLGYSNGAAIGLLQEDTVFQDSITLADSFSFTTASSNHFFYGNTSAKYGFSQYS